MPRPSSLAAAARAASTRVLSIDVLTRFRRHGLSTRASLVVLVVALLGPGLVFTAVLLDRYARTERARFEANAREGVRGIATAVDRDVAGLVATLRTLATAGRLREGDYAGFHRQALAVRGYTGLDVVLRDAAGREIVDTREPFGAVLRTAPRPYDARVLAERRPIVSGVLTARDGGTGPTYAVAVPVAAAGSGPESGPDLVLAFEIPTDRLRDILRQESRPGWTAGLADAAGTVMTRTEGHDPATAPGGPAAIRDGVATTWTGEDPSGRSILHAAGRTRLTDWAVGIGVPQAVVEAPVQRWIAAFVGFGILALALSSLAATRLWSLVQAPLRAYAAAADALANGAALPALKSPVREVRRLGEGLAAASAALHARMLERDAALAEQARGLAALRESEARFRHMADSAPALIWMTDAQGALTFANMHYDHLFGRPAAEMHGGGWLDVLHPEDAPAFAAAFAEAFAAREPFRGEVRVLDREGAVRWLRCEGVPRLDDAGAFLGFTGCNVDVTEAKVAEDHQTLLIHELNHRVKNTLATVQSVAAQSLRGISGPGADLARTAFEARLLALARAHDVLTRQNWEGAELGEVAADAVAPLDAGALSRFTLEGPRLRLPPRTALSVAMALHELGTNAVKYGALSTAAGRVAIRWSLDAGGGRLRLAWTERGGPRVAPPERRGFGSRLIERNLARELDGEVALRFEPEGVTCTIDAPLPREDDAATESRPASAAA